ncbi:MAG: C40 family peptidase [Spirochaetaceae bacterium]|nr:C40 family peptidase [Spirochaetaceae bacterium]
MRSILKITLFVLALPLIAQSNWREDVVAAAYLIMERGQPQSNGRWFNRDCSGFVMAIFMEAGHDLTQLTWRHALAGQGLTATLHNVARQNGALVNNSSIQPGDLVFFDNTFNRTAGFDLLTHLGIVTGFDAASGRVTFIHYNTFFDRVMEEELNVREPANPQLNIILRWPMANDPQQERLAGQLINSFGRPF